MRVVGKGAVPLALLLAGCGQSEAPSTGNADRDGRSGASQAGAAVALQAASKDPDGLAMPAGWLPGDWDRDVYAGSGERLDNEGTLKSRQTMLNTIPFTLWAVANDTRLTEAFEPIWVWYTAIRSCERGIELSEDLAGEFGNRERGRAGLARARGDLKKWAATQPPEMTLYFTARLGQWNDVSGTFPMHTLSRATTLRPQDVEAIDPDFDGANVELWSDRTGHAINHFQASLVAPQCASADGTRIYRFPRMSQWWVTFGEVDRGMGGLADYKSREMLPAIAMTREDATDFAQRNSERKVVVAVTFAPVGSTFLKGIDQSAIRAKLRRVAITDTVDDTVLAAKDY